MCLRLQVSQPLRDLVWLFTKLVAMTAKQVLKGYLLRGGPPPGPAIATSGEMRSTAEDATGLNE